MPPICHPQTASVASIEVAKDLGLPASASGPKRIQDLAASVTYTEGVLNIGLEPESDANGAKRREFEVASMRVVLDSTQAT